MKEGTKAAAERIPFIERAEGAIVAAAVGDAMGWPQETRSHRVAEKNDTASHDVRGSFRGWERRAGGRFYSHEEIIRPGEYSDDTQLLLCTARSLICAPDWWLWLARRELPTWTMYERGGGGALKRAADVWLEGQEPWSRSAKTRDSYFHAGGNGAAMRILPHCIRGSATLEDFNTIGKDIVANAVCTHGHPRALIGALAYGFACFVALKETATLQYGSLLEKLLESMEVWSALPRLDDMWKDWRLSAEEANGRPYEEVWIETVNEMRILLEQSRSGMRQGALSIDEDVLTKLGCFDKRVNGAGTITAAAAIFLASRYAVDPINGISLAAFLRGADTDTLASMTGGLLGAISGIEWIGELAGHVQDASYIREIGEKVIAGKWADEPSSRKALTVSKRELTALVNSLGNLHTEDIVQLPDGREARLSEPQQNLSKSPSVSVISWRLNVRDGQSIYIKKISRIGADNRPAIDKLFPHTVVAEPPANFKAVEVVKAGIKLPVKDMAEARSFYEKGLGLRVVRKSNSLVNLNEVIALVDLETERHSHLPNERAKFSCSTVHIEVRHLDPAYENVRKLGMKILTEISQNRSLRYFRCTDPDGNVVEVFEVYK